MKDVAEPALPRRPYWRFSLRELLLLVLAIAAILGWGQSIYQRFKPLEATALVRNFELGKEIAFVRQQLGETGPDFASVGEFSAGSVGPSQYRTAECNVLLASDDLSMFMTALLSQFFEKIRENDC